MGSLGPVWAWLRAHWRPVCTIVLMIVTFVLGRYSVAPTVKTETHETVKTVQLEDTQSKELVRVLTAQLTELKRNVHRVTHVVTKPDGSSETTTVVDSSEHRTAATTVDAAKTATAARHAETTTDETRSAVRVSDAPKAQWHASAMVGLDVPGLLKGAPTVVYGAHVERRVLGPIWAGAWGLSSGAGGVSLGLEF